MAQRSGFTLIELIVIILVIALLSALIVPALSYAREQARRKSCSQTLRAVAYAMFMYADVPANGTYPTAGNPEDAMLSLGLLYNKYVADPRVFSCPSNPVSMSAMTPGGPAASSYGYDPGHGPKSGDNVAILADMKGKGKNSDNHGRDAGQNIVTAAGIDIWMDTPYRLDSNGKQDNIFNRDFELSRDADAYIRR